ncbi:hypothetical protein BJV78DRAFT_1152933 [Lactifluus subvellereus]|nr:hypothetical protein BJV78DRAFT_1152933 [Lactifluus subvellereus]
MSRDEKSRSAQRRFPTDVEETIRPVLEQEDTDGNFQISMTDFFKFALYACFVTYASPCSVFSTRLSGTEQSFRGRIRREPRVKKKIMIKIHMLSGIELEDDTLTNGRDDLPLPSGSSPFSQMENGICGCLPLPPGTTSEKCNFPVHLERGVLIPNGQDNRIPLSKIDETEGWPSPHTSTFNSQEWHPDRLPSPRASNRGLRMHEDLRRIPDEHCANRQFMSVTATCPTSFHLPILYVSGLVSDIYCALTERRVFDIQERAITT